MAHREQLPRAWHDFDYPGVGKIAAQEAKRRFEWPKDPRRAQGGKSASMG
jgi:hypothetical protein